MNDVILVDCDGVLLNWEYAFGVWMERHGYELVDDYQFMYKVHEKYNIDSDFGHELCKRFNESAMVGFIPALRDAVHYVKMLHEKHGKVFDVITSMSSLPEAHTLRKQNLQKLFGEKVFREFVILDTGADKDEALEEYRNSGCFWIEDKPENAVAGLNVGLKPILMEHGHNMNHEHNHVKYPVVTNWKEICDIVLGANRYV